MTDQVSATNNHKYHHQSSSSLMTTTTTTSSLENKLRTLRDEANKHSQVLTQKLASSPSGQNLLHIGSSLSSLPPDLHTLLSTLHPIVSAVESSEQRHLQNYQQLLSKRQDIQWATTRIQDAKECAELYQDLTAAERHVQNQLQWLRQQQQQQQQQQVNHNNNGNSSSNSNNANRNSDEGGHDRTGNETEEDDYEESDLDQLSLLERAAHTALYLLQELKTSTEKVAQWTTTASTTGNNNTTNNNNTSSSSSSSSTTMGTKESSSLEPIERPQFILKLAPRIRRLESDTLLCLTRRLEDGLNQFQQHQQQLLQAKQQQQEQEEEYDAAKDDGPSSQPTAPSTRDDATEKELLKIGHCMRGLALLGQGQDVESIFARVAIMPLIRSKVSMGRLDEGGSRGECAGLPSLLEDMVSSIQQSFGPVLQLGQSIFTTSVVVKATTANGSSGEQQEERLCIDLVTAGVWVPIATALMADAGIKMAIFSPGIARILQANYVALDTFLAKLAERLLTSTTTTTSPETAPTTVTANMAAAKAAAVATSNVDHTANDLLGGLTKLYVSPYLSPDAIRRAQDRIYQHAKTAEFSKRWNLPIYYQLRFGECCSRLNKAIDQTQREGWSSEAVFSKGVELAEQLKHQAGFELPLFLELYDILLSFWQSDVFLQPLTHRFLRGAVQLTGRTVAFIQEGMEGKIKFGQEPAESIESSHPEENGVERNGAATAVSVPVEIKPHVRAPYCWGDSVQDVAAVAWELTLLESRLTDDYLGIVEKALVGGDNSDLERQELRKLASEVLREASEQLAPLIVKAWNETVVTLLITKCSAPLAAVRGVAATYRMTNRPPPSQASPFVATILRPLKEFHHEFVNRTPPQIGNRWKFQIVQVVAERYSANVEELITTVQRTEVALKNRKAKRIASGGMSDGEKVKLQLYLDYKEFSKHVQECGIEVSAVPGVQKLRALTMEAETLQEQHHNGS